MFLRNCWYLAAWSDEIAAGDMLGRQIAGAFLLFVRDADGALAALPDQCPHRLVPLSMGKCASGIVECAYHGLRFAASGRCVTNPHGPVTSALHLRPWPCVERHSAVWVWLGEADADDDAIPDLGFIDRVPEEARVYGRLHSTADYRLMTDNIMDLTHADYLHASSLGGGINTRARAEAVQQGDGVTITWTASNDRLAPLHAGFLDSEDGRGDFLNIVTWMAPAVMRQRIAFALPGALESAPLDSMTCHVMTPETAGTTHYFFCHTSDGVTADPAIAPQVHDALVAAFAGEDAPMLEAQTRRFAGRDFWSLKPALLPSDKGAVMVRRLLDRMMAEENKGLEQ